jgi:hypothetical protein
MIASMGKTGIKKPAVNHAAGQLKIYKPNI